MKDLSRMRLGVLKELKNVHKFFDNMEKRVRNREPESIQRAYVFLQTMVILMEEGALTPENVALNLELAQELQELYE